MALNLGGTISDLQSKMGYREYLLWCLYRKKYGPLNPVRMFDQAGAMVAFQVNRAHGGKANPIDFMPFAPNEPEVELSENEVLDAIARGGKIGR